MMSIFTAPKWDVDEHSEKLAEKVLDGIASSKNKKKDRLKMKKQQKKIRSQLNSSPSDGNPIQTKAKPSPPWGGPMKTFKSKDGLKVKTPGGTVSGATNRNSDHLNGSHKPMSKSKRRKLAKKAKLLKQQQLSNTSLSEAGTSSVKNASIPPTKGKNKKNKKIVSDKTLVDSRSKLEKLFEVEKKRKKVKKIKEVQGNKPSLVGSPQNLSAPETINNKKLKKMLKKEQKLKKKGETFAVGEENTNSCEVVLNSKKKMKMLKTAKNVSECKSEKLKTVQHVQGTSNPSFDTSVTDSDPITKELIKSKKLTQKKKKISTDSVDGNFVSTFKKYKLGSKLKKSVLPSSSVSAMVSDKIPKRKLSVSKLLQKALILDPSVSSDLEKKGLEAPVLDSTISYDVKKTRKLGREGAFQNPGSSSPKDKKQKQAPTSLREKMVQQLKSARFRWLNEQLYCSNSWDALKYFKEDPDAYEAYHSGYRNQVAQWPVNPVDVIIKAISSLPSEFVVADFGCGDAHLAASLPDRKVHSLDLIASKPGVIACDMAHTPLLMESVDVAVFCLSLMGTNLIDFLLEANRVLKTGGILYIAEVESRFEDIDNFTSSMVHFGFTLKKKDISHQMFIFMDFKKARKVTKSGKLPELTLEPCLYKRR